jgi:hypothetical protein
MFCEKLFAVYRNERSVTMNDRETEPADEQEIGKLCGLDATVQHVVWGPLNERQSAPRECTSRSAESDRFVALDIYLQYCNCSRPKTALLQQIVKARSWNLDGWARVDGQDRMATPVGGLVQMQRESARLVRGRALNCLDVGEIVELNVFLQQLKVARLRFNSDHLPAVAEYRSKDAAVPANVRSNVDRQIINIEPEVFLQTSQDVCLV